MLNDSNNLDFLDIINIVSFAIAIANYNENLNQTDKQELIHKLDKQTSELLSQLNTHLERQDENIDKILTMLEVKQ